MKASHKRVLKLYMDSFETKPNTFTHFNESLECIARNRELHVDNVNIVQQGFLSQPDFKRKSSE